MDVSPDEVYTLRLSIKFREYRVSDKYMKYSHHFQPFRQFCNFRFLAISVDSIATTYQFIYIMSNLMLSVLCIIISIGSHVLAFQTYTVEKSQQMLTSFHLFHLTTTLIFILGILFMTQDPRVLLLSSPPHSYHVIVHMIVSYIFSQ